MNGIFFIANTLSSKKKESFFSPSSVIVFIWNTNNKRSIFVCLKKSEFQVTNFREEKNCIEFSTKKNTYKRESERERERKWQTKSRLNKRSWNRAKELGGRERKREEKEKRRKVRGGQDERKKFECAHIFFTWLLFFFCPYQSQLPTKIREIKKEKNERHCAQKSIISSSEIERKRERERREKKVEIFENDY